MKIPISLILQFFSLGFGMVGEGSFFVCCIFKREEGMSLLGFSDKLKSPLSLDSLVFSLGFGMTRGREAADEDH